MKKELDAIIKKGLTGAEMGKLCLKDLIAVYEGKGRIFTREDIDQLSETIKDIDERRIANAYFKLVECIQMRLSIAGMLYIMTAKSELNRLSAILMGLWTNQAIRDYQNTYEIMTEKQYSEAQAIQKKEKLTKDFSLSLVMLFIAEDYIRNRREKIADLWKQYEKEKEEGNKKDNTKIYGTDLLNSLFYYYAGEEYHKGLIKAKHTDYYSYGIEGFKEDFPDFFKLVLAETKKLISSKKLKIAEDIAKLPLKEYNDIKIKGNVLEGLGIKYITNNIIDAYIPEPAYDHRTVLIAKNPPDYNLDGNGYYKEAEDLEHILHISSIEKTLEDPKIAEALEEKFSFIQKGYFDIIFVTKKAIELLTEKMDYKTDIILSKELKDLEEEVTLINAYIKRQEFREKISGHKVPLNFKEINLKDYENPKTETMKLVTKYIKDTPLTAIDPEVIVDYILEGAKK